MVNWFVALAFALGAWGGGGPTPTSPLSVWVVEGDSLSDSLISDYPGLYLPNARPSVAAVDFAVAGSTLNDAIARQATVDMVITTNRDAPRFIFSALIGGNGFCSAGSQCLLDQITALATYYDGRRAAGFKVVCITWTPRTTALFNPARNQVNVAIRTWQGTHCDAIADFAADPIMGPDAAASDVSLYSDGTHPTALGHSYLEADIRPVLNGLLH